MGHQIRALPEVQVGQRIRDCPIQRYKWVNKLGHCQRYMWVNESGAARYRGTGGSTNQGLPDTEVQVGQRITTLPDTEVQMGQRITTLPDTEVQAGQRITTLPDTEVQAGQCRTQRQATGMGAHASPRLQAGHTNYTSAWTYTYIQVHDLRA